MTHEEIWEGVREVMSNSLQAPIEKLTPEARLVKDLDIDSLFVVQITMDLEEKFGIQVADADIPNFKTVSDIVQYVENKLGTE